MASIQPVNRGDIAEGFAPHAPSSGKGSHVLHNNPQAQSQKKTKRALGPATSRHSPSSARLHPQTSIQEGFATNPISSVSSGTEPRAGHFEPQVLEPVEIASAEKIMEKMSKMIKKLKQKLARLTQKCLPEKKKIQHFYGIS